MESDYDNYDYEEDLAQKPRVFGFFFGWFGQELLSQTYSCDTGEPVSPEPTWDQCARELYRLAAMVCAWRDAHGAVLPDGLATLFHSLTEAYGPAGYRSSSEAIRGPADPDDPRKHRTLFDPEPRDYWPDLVDPSDELTGRLGEVVSSIRKVLTEVGRWTDQENAVCAGAALARYATGPWFDPEHDNDKIDSWLTALVDLELMAKPDGCDDVNEGGVSLLHRLRERLGHTEEVEADIEALRNLPFVVCDHAECPSLPRRSKIQVLPDLKSRIPSVHPAHNHPPITLQREDQPILVLDEPKPCPSTPAYSVLSALAEAYPHGVSREEIEKKASDARGILRRLQEDADWQKVIRMPGRAGTGGYRLVWPED